VVQECAHIAWNKTDGDFRQLISQAEIIVNTLSTEEIDACFDPNHHLQNLDQIYQRLGI
jgi:adenylosuccinate lyase